MPEGDPARARALAAENGWGYKRIAAHFGVSRDRARDWLNPARRKRLRRGQDHRRGAPGRARAKARRLRQQQRRALVVVLWNAGAPITEICARLSWSRGHLSVEMDRMRREGYALPYRYRVRDGHRIAASD